MTLTPGRRVSDHGVIMGIQWLQFICGVGETLSDGLASYTLVTDKLTFDYVCVY